MLFISLANSLVESHAAFYLEQSRAVVSGQRQPGRADSVHRRFGRPLHRDVLANVAGKLNHIFPFVAPAVGVLVFAAASLLKDTVNRLGDLLDDGQPNSSFNS